MPPTLFSKRKSRGMNDSDIWDDSLLIKAYEESIRLHKEDVAKRLAMSTNKRKENVENSEQSEDEKVEEFKVGSYVRATYEDGIDYEAEILKIEENGSCKIRFIGYDNEDYVKLEDLVPSWGKKTRDEQMTQSEIDKEYETSSEKEPEEDFQQHMSTNYKNLPIPPMPPMPPGLFDGSQDSEYLSAMLMSWYMSGYYTGLYQGKKQQQEEQHNGPKKRKSNKQ